MVQAKTLNEIEQAWRAAGEPYCDHPRSDDEFYLSARSGDKGCLDCGDTWPKGSKSEPRGNRSD